MKIEGEVFGVIACAALVAFGVFVAVASIINKDFWGFGAGNFMTAAWAGPLAEHIGELRRLLSATEDRDE